MVFKPAAVSRLDSLFLTEAVREHPVVLDPYAFDETVKINVPDGFQVDEMPDPIKLDAQHRSFAMTKSITIQLTRLLYDNANEFFGRV